MFYTKTGPFSTQGRGTRSWVSTRRGLLIILICSVAWCPCACSTPVAEPTLQTLAPRATPTVVSTATPLPTAVNSEYLEIFEEVWSTIFLTYFDLNFGGVDWYAVHAEYKPLIREAEDEETLYRLLNQMLWELNVSHAGVGPADIWPSIEPVVFEKGEIGMDVRLLTVGNAGDAQAVVTRVESLSSAEDAGLRPGFIIQSIEGSLVEDIIAEAEEHLPPPYNDAGHIDGLTRKLLGLLYGDPSACVTLAYLDEKDELQEECVERIARPWEAYMNGIPLPPSYLEFESGRLEGGIGYIRFNTFHNDLIPNLVEAVAALQDAPGIIIDLRGNPGGDPNVVEKLAAQFLDGEFLYGSFTTRSGMVERTVTGKNVYTGPLVILIDHTSYSASECFSSAMQALGRAVIVGERSPGGVTGMDVRTLQNGDIMGYPVAQFITPDGIVREGYGVIPDIAVSLERDQLLKGFDAQLQAAIQYINETRR